MKLKVEVYHKHDPTEKDSRGVTWIQGQGEITQSYVKVTGAWWHADDAPPRTRYIPWHRIHVVVEIPEEGEP